jgi:hypothetical protein
MHETIDEQGAWLRRVVIGFIPTNAAALSDLPSQRRRSLAADTTSAWPKRDHDVGANDCAGKSMVPTPRIIHLGPDKRFAVKHPR